MNYTNEINQIIGALKDGAGALTPVAKELVAQYVLRSQFCGWSCLLFATVLALVIAALIRKMLRTDDVDTRAECLIGSLLLGVALFVCAIISVHEFGCAVAPLPSLLGR